jgi:hypothetical protein
MDRKGIRIRDSTIMWALHSQMAHGNDDMAYNFLLAASDASEGIVSPYNPATRLRGAVNRQGVTCFLDATLFAIFSRLDSFEAMLYNEFDDLPRRKLSFLLRLWVNMLRTGQLVTTDITERIQASIADCGWLDAAELHQQDASEAFTFITGKLELPLLTLKMDIYHSGKEDTQDDHKFINERLLEVAIPEDSTGEKKSTTLEECLEEYFNNRVEVRRYLERRSTVSSQKSPLDNALKNASIHVETIEVDPESSPATPTISAPLDSPIRPPTRPRQPSIIQDRYVPSRTTSGRPTINHSSTEGSGRTRSGSLRKTVMMPGWQFFSLIPWYTDNAPSNDAQVAAHFSSKRPVLGLCLKRYTFKNGRPARLGTYIDIPTEVGLPHFIQDDQNQETTSIGSFILSLQSVVCHRGSSVDSGHYISLVRGTTPASSSAESESTKQWLRFDDLAPQRITVVDINQALREETPYLLFYQILPMEEENANRSDTEASEVAGGLLQTSPALSRVSTAGFTSGRPSFEITGPDTPEKGGSGEGRRQSVVSLANASDGGSTTSLKAQHLHERRGSLDASGGRSVSKGRDSSSGIGRTLSKLAKRRSREVTQESVPRRGSADIQVREVTDLTPEATAFREPVKANTLAVVSPADGRQHKRHSSKSKRLSRGNGKSKDGTERECLVM